MARRRRVTSGNVKVGKPVGPKKPFVAPDRPPPGTYDPALDAQQRAANRGFGDLQQDTTRDSGRLTEDFALGVRDTQQAFDWGSQDLATALQRGTQDYGSNTQGLQRSYQRLGDSQSQAAQQAGVTGGGTLAAALAARTQNQGVEQGALDTNFNRFQQDNSQSLSRLGTQRDQGIGRLTLGHTRGQDDLATNLARGGRENTAFGSDVAEQRFFQAGQTGWQMPKPPAASPARKRKPRANDPRQFPSGLGKSIAQGIRRSGYRP